MCFECIFNYFLLPLGGIYGAYYFLWLKFGKVLKEYGESLMKRVLSLEEKVAKDSKITIETVEDYVNDSIRVLSNTDKEIFVNIAAIEHRLKKMAVLQEELKAKIETTINQNKQERGDEWENERDG